MAETVDSEPVAAVIEAARAAAARLTDTGAPIPASEMESLLGVADTLHAEVRRLSGEVGHLDSLLNDDTAYRDQVYRRGVDSIERADRAESARDAVVVAVRALHAPAVMDASTGWPGVPHQVCDHDARPYPCPTVSALDHAGQNAPVDEYTARAVLALLRDRLARGRALGPLVSRDDLLAILDGGAPAPTGAVTLAQEWLAQWGPDSAVARVYGPGGGLVTAKYVATWLELHAAGQITEEADRG